MQHWYQEYEIGNVVQIHNIGESSLRLCPLSPSPSPQVSKLAWVARLKAECNMIFWDKRNYYISTMKSHDESHAVS